LTQPPYYISAIMCLCLWPLFQYWNTYFKI